MIPSTLFAFVAALSSFAAVNGAVIQRDGTFTYLTPQPTAPGQAATTTTSTTATSTTSRSSTTTSTQSTTSITSGMTATSTTPATTSTNTGTTSVTVTLPTTTTTTSVSVTRPTTPTSTGTTTPATVIPPITTSPTSTNTVTTTPATVIPPITTSPTTTSPITTPAPGAANCNGIQQWQASFAYTAGDQVIFNGQLFTARQWTYNNAPNAHPDQWTAGGTCAQPINNLANCNGVAAWNRNVAYTTGNRVTSNGHLWSAVQWTQSNAPGDTSGSWKDLGACA